MASRKDRCNIDKSFLDFFSKIPKKEVLGQACPDENQQLL